MLRKESGGEAAKSHDGGFPSKSAIARRWLDKRPSASGIWTKATRFQRASNAVPAWLQRRSSTIPTPIQREFHVDPTRENRLFTWRYSMLHSRHENGHLAHIRSRILAFGIERFRIGARSMPPARVASRRTVFPRNDRSLACAERHAVHARSRPRARRSSSQRFGCGSQHARAPYRLVAQVHASRTR